MKQNELSVKLYMLEEMACFSTSRNKDPKIISKYSMSVQTSAMWILFREYPELCHLKQNLAIYQSLSP